MLGGVGSRRMRREKASVRRQTELMCSALVSRVGWGFGVAAGGVGASGRGAVSGTHLESLAVEVEVEGARLGAKRRAEAVRVAAGEGLSELDEARHAGDDVEELGERERDGDGVEEREREGARGKGGVAWHGEAWQQGRGARA